MKLYVFLWPGGIDGAYAAAQANITDLASIDLATLSATITTEIQTNTDLTNVTIDTWPNVIEHISRLFANLRYTVHDHT